MGDNFEPPIEGMRAYQFGLRKVGAVHSVKAESAELIHKITTYPGQSGAPVILNREGKLSIVGIHKGGVDALIRGKIKKFNSARLITSNLI